MNAEDSAELEKLKRDKIRAERKDKFKEVAQLCNVIGEVLARNGLYQDAITEHETELKLSEALEDNLGAGIACRKIGECYSEIGDFKQALVHQNRYLDTAKSCENLLEEQRAWATLGRTYLLQSEVMKEKLASNKASQSAEQAFIHSLEVLERLKSTINVTEYMQMKARLLLNLGLVYDGRGDLKKSAEFIKQAIDKTQKYELHEDLYRCQFSLACMYQRLGNMSNAVRQLEEAQNSAKRLKDKQLETDALSQKALFFSKLGDHSSARRSLKQANKLGAATADQKLQIQKLYTAVVRLEEISDDLSTIAPDDLAERARLYEKLGDLASKIENHKQAVDFYLQQLSCGEELKWPAAELSKVYVSLAQTYCDDKQYDLAIKFYRKELGCRQGDNKEMCCTMLNIADAEEQSGKPYDQIIRSYVAAYDYARLAKQPKLQVQALRSMVALQTAANKASHVAQTEKKLSGIQRKYGLSSEDEVGVEEEEDSQGSGRDEQEEEDVPISDLSESDVSDEEGTGQSTTGQPARGVGRRFSALTSKRNEKGETPLHRACIEGNLKKVKKLCEQGHPVNPRDFCGWIPLHEAANHDFPEVVEYLLSRGAWLNDRGGEQCGGVTPLHDAANCGNLQVMRILIEHGASCLAKDDEGLTALDCMRAWRERATETLSDEDKQLSVSMERMLLNRMGLREKCDDRMRHSSRSLSPQNSLRQTSVSDNSTAITIRQRRNQHQSASSDEDMELPTITSGRRKQHRSPQSHQMNMEVGGSESDDEIYSPTPAIDRQRSATDSYRNAIAAVGSSAVRPSNSLTNQGISDLRPSKSTNQRSALLDEGEIVGDDWLIEDMRPSSTKRKRPEMEKLMTTALRETTDSVHSSKRSRRSNERGSLLSDVENIEPPSEDYTIEDYDDALLISLNRENDNNAIEKSQIPCHADETHQRNPEVVMEAQGTQRSSRMSRRRRPRQLKLTSILSRNSAAASESDNDIIPDTSVDLTILPPSATDLRSAANPAGSAGGHVTPAVQTAMKVKVRVKEKLLLIPVLTSDSERPISWLAQETSRRYYSLYGVKPNVQLSTKDGALLSPDDLISLVLSSGDELLADVESWDLPPLQTRYAQACQSCHTVTYRNIQTLLQQCQQTGTLSLASLALRPSQLQPIIRSLQCQYNLKELHLQENRIDDTSLRSLSHVLDTLPNLSLLDLSANQITAVGLSNLSEAVEKSADNPTGKQSKALQVLTCLRLDHNPLGDGCVQGLLSLLRQLPLLERLGLASCSLSQNMFQHHRPLLAEVLKDSSLRRLDVSYNRLGSTGVELLLRCLNPGRVAGLALRATVSTWTASHVSKHLEQYATKGCVLEELDLSDCHFTGEDRFSLISILEHAKSLRKLKMNNNPLIDNSILTEVLNKSFQFDTTLEELETVGCGIVSPLASDFLDTLSDKLNGSYPLKLLMLSCRKLDKIDTDCLKQIWTDRWQGDAMCQFQEDCIQLSVKNVTTDH